MTPSMLTTELVHAHHLELRRRVEQDRRIRVARAERKADRSTTHSRWRPSLRFRGRPLPQVRTPVPAL
jgi:hypothetical protein